MPHLSDTRRPGAALGPASPSLLTRALCLSQAHWRGAGSGRPPLPIHLPRLTGALRYLGVPSEVGGMGYSGTCWIPQHLSALETQRCLRHPDTRDLPWLCHCLMAWLGSSASMGSTSIRLTSESPSSADTYRAQPLPPPSPQPWDKGRGGRCLDGQPGSPASSQGEVRLGLWGPR